jgi:protoheme IX farnesyltransferase
MSTTSAVNPGLLPVFRDLVALTKPRVSGLVLATAAVGMGMAPGTISVRRAVWMMVGTWLCVASANALNCFIERESDKRMRRTSNRPLPAGRLDPALARAFGVSLGLISLPVLALGTNLITSVLGLIALVSYVGVYTPMKQRSPLALIVGAVPGALPPLMGYAAVSGELGAKGILLFALMFLWQIPHVIGLSAFRREDYVAAGIRVLPAVLDEDSTRLHALFWACVLWAVSLVPAVFGWTGQWYLATAVLLGAWFVAATLRANAAALLTTWGRRVFSTSLFYLPLLFLALLIDGKV